MCVLFPVVLLKYAKGGKRRHVRACSGMHICVRTRRVPAHKNIQLDLVAAGVNGQKMQQNIDVIIAWRENGERQELETRTR